MNGMAPKKPCMSTVRCLFSIPKRLMTRMRLSPGQDSPKNSLWVNETQQREICMTMHEIRRYASGA